jgi:hypothetical protein
LWIAVSRSAPQQRGNSCCLASELLDDLDAPHSANELTEHGRLIAKAGADLQHDVVLPRLQQIGHDGNDEGL